MKINQQIGFKDSILLIDGTCVLCNKCVQFYLRHEKNNKLQFASLQSEVGKQIAQQFFVAQSLDTLVLVADGRVYFKSNAVFKLTRDLSGLWPLLQVFRVLPIFFSRLCV